MKLLLRSLVLRTRKTTERIEFSETVTFLHGPVSTGKSTVARLIDYCLGGDLERTPAIQQEFVSVELALDLDKYKCTLERAADDTQSVRVNWSAGGDDTNSVSAPLAAGDTPLIDAEVYNLSDLIFHLLGVVPIKVKQRSRDPDSPLIRLSIRDVWWYCYLEQTHLDSSFFRLEDPFRGRKSQDAMRFFTGLHSERLSQLESELTKIIDEQRSKREAVQQIRTFMARFELGTELQMQQQLDATKEKLADAQSKKKGLEKTRTTQMHPTDALRDQLRALSDEIESLRVAIGESEAIVSEYKALRAELITAKTKASRSDEAGKILEGVHYQRCPECGIDISGRAKESRKCCLCGSDKTGGPDKSSMELEALRRDLNDRIDQIKDSILRREREINRMSKRLADMQQAKTELDQRLQDELSRYDSAFVESIRGTEREIATLSERIKSLTRLQQMPRAISGLEEEAGALQGTIDRLRTAILEERESLRAADENIKAIALEFKRVMLSVSFPGVSEDDDVVIDPRSWKPTIYHGDQVWTFMDAGSGGKKTLFNVCYALAIHRVALERGMPVPNVLIIDSPTKNISEDKNPELVRSLYSEIYKLARIQEDHPNLQFLLIDSDIIMPTIPLEGFVERRMAGVPEAPSLIPYYVGP